MKNLKNVPKQNNELAVRFGLIGIKAVGHNVAKNICHNSSKKKFTDIYDFAARSDSKVINKKTIEALAKSGSFDSILDNRKQIFESQEILNKYSTLYKERINSNQISLFDETLDICKPKLKAVSDWQKYQKLSREFEAFGFFANQHPMENFVKDLQKKNVILSAELENARHGSNIKISGVICANKYRSGTKGRYAQLSFSDPTGIFEATIFDDHLINSSRDIIVTGNIVLLECFVKNDAGGIRLAINNIISIENFLKKKNLFNNEDKLLKNSTIEEKSDKNISEIKFVKKIVVKINSLDTLNLFKKFLFIRKNTKNNTDITICYSKQNKINKIKLPCNFLILKTDLSWFTTDDNKIKIIEFNLDNITQSSQQHYE